MLKCFLICDNNGLPFYSRTFNDFELFDDALFSGLIVSMGTLGKTLFNQDIATITFGMGPSASKIVTISRDLFSDNKQIHFVFFYDEEINLKSLRELTTTVFISTKNFLRSDVPEKNVVKDRVDNVIDSQFHSLTNW